ncbi:hypothetical protein [Clostridium tarantellae]|uniref:DUF4878 domain-containing protein n=1 Tax=Clostridium tarantellae TaxID=39493 RepID=A0A6I1MML1_9CLOT|nr:hypothetical protein [Clostridium tarantellae]MPQ44003.1 hypothetical protein [Clostridium tarantellae]
MRKIFSSMLLILVLFISLMGCGTIAKEKTPSDLVNDFLKAVSQKNIDAREMCIGVNKENSIGNRSEDEKIFFNEVFSKFQGEVTAEHLNESEAKVEVKVKGIDTGRVVDETVRVAYPMIMEASQTKERETGEGYSSEKIDRLMTESLMKLLKNQQVEERTGTISLVKNNDKWLVETNGELMRILVGNIPTGYSN